MGKKRKPISDFVVDTKGHCFLCLELVPPQLHSFPNLVDDASRAEPLQLYSLQYLTHFLKMDLGKAIRERTSVPPELLANVRNSKLKVELCTACSGLTERFSQLRIGLERIQLEINCVLDEIHRKLLNGKTANMKEQLGLGHIAESEMDTNDKFIEKLEVVEILRAEAINQYQKKRSCPQPRVKVQRFTEEEVAVRTHQIKSEACNCIIPNNDSSAFEETGTRDIKLESPFPNMATYNDASDYLNESDAYDESYANAECDESKCPTDKSSQSTNTSVINMDLDSWKSGRDPRKSFKHNNIRKLYIRQRDHASSSGKYKVTNAKRGMPRPLKLVGGFKCTECGKEYSCKQSYGRHYQNIHRKFRYSCDECSKTFNQREGLKFHKDAVHLLRRFPCRFCSKTFSQPSARNRHNNMAHFHPK